MESFDHGTRVRTGLGFDEATEKAAAALKAQGFGVLTEIDVQAIMKEKLGIDVVRYLILGACNPNLAHRALEAEQDPGLLLPCNVIVNETKEGTVVAVLNPGFMAKVTGNSALDEVAAQASRALEHALQAVAAG